MLYSATNERLKELPNFNYNPLNLSKRLHVASITSNWSKIQEKKTNKTKIISRNTQLEIVVTFSNISYSVTLEYREPTIQYLFDVCK